MEDHPCFCKEKKDLVMGVILNQVLAGFYYTSNRRFMENSEEQYLTKGPISISGYGTLPFILNWRKFASCRSKPKNLRKCHLVYYVTLLFFKAFNLPITQSGINQQMNSWIVFKSIFIFNVH